MLRFVLALSLVVAATAPAHGSARLPGEYDAQSALLIGCQNLLDNHPKTLRELAHALHGDVEVYGLVNTRADARRMTRFLEESGIEPGRIRPIVHPTRGMWVRDYGPLFVTTEDGPVIVDARYKVEPDDTVPSSLGKLWGVPAAETALWAEGGHLVHNGRGLLLVSTMLARLNSTYDGVGAEEIRTRLQSSLPFEQAHWIEPMPGEPTGHLDMFMVFVGPRRLVVAEIDPAEDAELAAMLDATAERLGRLDQDGERLEILRVPTPAPRDGVWFSYTNVILIGDQVLVPRYAMLDDASNRRAKEFWREAMPDREVTAVDATSIIRRNGALHCISMPLPGAIGSRIPDDGTPPVAGTH